MFDAFGTRHVRGDYIGGLASFDADLHPDPSAEAELVSTFIEHIRSEPAKGHRSCASGLASFSPLMDVARVNRLAFGAHSYFCLKVAFVGITHIPLYLTLHPTKHVKTIFVDQFGSSMAFVVFGFEPTETIKVFSKAPDRVVFLVLWDVANPTVEPVLDHRVYYVLLLLLSLMERLC